MRAVLYCTNIVSRGIHRRAMSRWPSRWSSWNRANLNDNRDNRTLVVFIMMAAKWPSLSLSLWSPLASVLVPTFDCRLNWVDPNSKMIINRSDQIRTRTTGQNWTSLIRVLLLHQLALRCTKENSIWSCFFVPKIHFFKRYKLPFHPLLHVRLARKACEFCMKIKLLSAALY